ncbi:MAG: NeuD/PglB/VioB family sugar acetyltransferase [Acidimicrobiales bacterium]
MTPLVIVGAGGHGRETADIVAAINTIDPRFDLIGVVDDEHQAGILGPAHPDVVGASRTVIAIGDPAVRARMAARLGESTLEQALVHPSATMGSDVAMGPGAIVAAGVRLTTNIRTGVHVHLNPNVVVSHDCRLGDFVSCSPGVILSGNVTIGDRVLLGSGAVVLPGCHIGDDVVVGAGAVVTADVESGNTVVGVPARPTNQH